MRFAGWFGVVVGLLMIATWVRFFAAGQVPELQTEPLRMAFHLAGELVTAVCVIFGGVALLRGFRWAASVYLLGAGMLLYSVIVSPGYFAQQGQWALVAMFGILFALTLVSITAIIRSEWG